MHIAIDMLDAPIIRYSVFLHSVRTARGSHGRCVLGLQGKGYKGPGL